jgi:hypothetical protein
MHVRTARLLGTTALRAGIAAVSGVPAHARPVESEATARVGGCVGTAFSGTLEAGKAICNGNYLVRMQPNGDLVLRVISTGDACWTSGTAVAPGGDTSATFHGGPVGKPFVTIDSVSQGRLKQIVGAHTYLHLGTNASVNTRGEFWIGYKKIASC